MYLLINLNVNVKLSKRLIAKEISLSNLFQKNAIINIIKKYRLFIRFKFDIYFFLVLFFFFSKD